MGALIFYNYLGQNRKGLITSPHSVIFVNFCLIYIWDTFTCDMILLHEIHPLFLFSPQFEIYLQIHFPKLFYDTNINLIIFFKTVKPNTPHLDIKVLFCFLMK